MQVSGTMLNVGDGDAIILTLERSAGQKLLIVIDGGNISYGNAVTQRVKEKCQELDKEGPDLVVCTHYDSDHIAGIISLVEHFGNKIKEIWIHEPPDVIKRAIAASKLVLEKIMAQPVKLTEDANALHLLYRSGNIKNYQMIIESVDQLKELVELITNHGIPKKQPIAGECSYANWPEIQVIGPTTSYFEKVFGQLNSPTAFASDEYEHLLLENELTPKKIQGDPCAKLKKTSNITATNKASAIIKIEFGAAKLLFTADAGIESFQACQGYPGSISNLTFLKVPHHGSNNNISKELIEIMKPEYAYSSGNRHEDPEVIGCLQKNARKEVKTTKKDGELRFRFPS